MKNKKIEKQQKNKKRLVIWQEQVKKGLKCMQEPNWDFEQKLKT